MARSMKLVAQTVEVSGLSEAQRDAMWQVFSRYYADVSRDVFERDLGRKQQVILLRDSGDGSLQGFSTIEVYARSFEGRPLIAVFSGDTVVDKDYWGQSTLQRAFFAFLMKTKLQNPLTPVYWFLISKGYKTYLLLTRNFATYWPRHDRATPEKEAALISTLAKEKYPHAFDEARGVLRFAESEGRLKDNVAPIDASLLADADIRFFVEQNPGHARGDELCCIGEVNLRLATRFVGKHLRRAMSLTRPSRKPWATASS